MGYVLRIGALAAPEFGVGADGVHVHRLVGDEAGAGTLQESGGLGHSALKTVEIFLLHRDFLFSTRAELRPPLIRH